MRSKLLETTDRGLYCTPGDFYIDPWRPVRRAVITHGHGDHARWGMEHYLTHRLTVPILKLRISPDVKAQGVEYGEAVTERGVKISFHPAGHIVGSAQVRLEYEGEVAVVSGDYKVGEDRLSAPFEPVRCHTFISECTFGLPIFKWKPESEIADEINAWWRENAEAGRCSLLLGYSLGKAQRLLSLLDLSTGPAFAHGAVEAVTDVLRYAGVPLPPLPKLTRDVPKETLRRALVIAPPSAADGPWANRLRPASVGFASGWMAMRGARRRRSLDRGFVLSDHADWEGLNGAIKETGASKIYVTHGYTAAFARWLKECGYDAAELETTYGDDAGEEAAVAPEAAE